MIRQLLNQSVTQLANDVLPTAVGDKWLNTNFTVLFTGRGLRLLQPAYNDDEIWRGIAIIEGEASIRILSNEKTPIDPIPLAAALFISPIIVHADPNLTENEVTAQFKFLPIGVKDELFPEGIVPVLTGQLEGHLIQRRDDVTVYTAGDIGDVEEWLYKGG